MCERGRILGTVFGLERVLAGKGRHRHQAGAVWMAVGEGWVKAELWRVSHSFISPGITHTH